MSIRAYKKEIIEEKIEKINGENKRVITVVQDISPLFNVWNQNEIFDIFIGFGFDGTNCDSVGEIELSFENWEQWKDEYYPSHKELYQRDDLLEVLQEIDSYFKLGHEYLTCECL